MVQSRRVSFIASMSTDLIIKARYVDGSYLKSPNKKHTKTRLVSDFVLGTRFPISGDDLG